MKKAPDEAGAFKLRMVLAAKIARRFSVAQLSWVASFAR